MKEHLKIAILALVVGILFGILLIVLTRGAGANEKVDLCHKTSSNSNPWVVQEVNANEVQSHLANGDFYYQGQYGIHTQQAKNWCKNHQPEVTPTPTPVVECDDDCEVTPTPTVTQCFDGEFPVDCPVVTPTPEEPTPTPGEKGPETIVTNNTTQAPGAATCNVPFEQPRAWYTKVDGKVIFNWADDAQGITKYSIVYGYTPDSLVYGVDNLPSDSRSLDINGLDSTKHTFFQIQAWKDGCMEGSAIIDP